MTDEGVFARKLRQQRYRQLHPDRTRASGYRWYHQNGGREKQKNTVLLRRYGIDLQTKARMYEEQLKSCALCRVQSDIDKLHVDHCHTTKKVRGLLCNRCNGMVGYVELADLTKVFNYLKGSYDRTS